MSYTEREIEAYARIRGRIVGHRIFVGQIVAAVFIILKLTGSLTWSWWWITAPAWGGIVYFAIAVVGGGLFAVVNGSSK